jgi:predicted HD phosphohydrolase
MKTVRKNAHKKIAQLLNDAVGIIAKTSSMQIDDSYNDTRRIVTPDEVIAWLADDFNYNDARLYVDGKRFKVAGPYYFCDCFTAYFDEQEYQADLAWHKLAPAPEPATPSNVVFVDFTARPRAIH